MPLLHDSITKIPKKELVAHVVNDVQYRDTLFNMKHMFTEGARVAYSRASTTNANVRVSSHQPPCATCGSFQLEAAPSN